jgi:hypothetical protein
VVPCAGTDLLGQCQLWGMRGKPRHWFLVPRLPSSAWRPRQLHKRSWRFLAGSTKGLLPRPETGVGRTTCRGGRREKLAVCATGSQGGRTGTGEERARRD